ncbi:MAG: pseudouridine synthase [Vicinamibacterales bacterium]
MTAVRLQKLLSAAGVASRRAAEGLITSGRVTVNGRTVLELGTRADDVSDVVRVDGVRIGAAPLRYILLNKPRGYVTTRSDPQGRPTILSLLGNLAEYLYPVGRLDYDSVGLLIVTNDGALTEKLTHPRHGIEKIYEAAVFGVPDDRALARLRSGVVLDGRPTAAATVRLLRRITRGPRITTWLEIGLREGRQRQVRRMCEAVGHRVLRLRRVRVGPIADAQLKPGAWRDLTPREIRALREAVNATAPPSRSAAVPGRSPGRANDRVRRA